MILSGRIDTAYHCAPIAFRGSQIRRMARRPYDGTMAGLKHRGAPRVFISSTSEDLKPYRERARKAANAAGYLPIIMEDFAAGNRLCPGAWRK